MFTIIISIWIFSRVEFKKQYRQSVMKSEVNFFKSVIQKVQRLKIKTMVVVYEKKTTLLFDMIDE